MLQILRKDFLSQQKQREDDLARSAPNQTTASDEDGADEPQVGRDVEGKLVPSWAVAW